MVDINTPLRADRDFMRGRTEEDIEEGGYVATPDNGTDSMKIVIGIIQSHGGHITMPLLKAELLSRLQTKIDYQWIATALLSATPRYLIYEDQDEIGILT